jgi:uncharacterized membrane protein YfcA
MQWEWLGPLLLVLAGAVAGFINTVAGAGSILTIPALLLVGVPADAANATNRIGVLAQSLSGGAGFHRAGKVPWEAVPRVVFPTLGGAALGAYLAATLPERPIRLLLLGAMVVMGAMLWWRPNALAPDPGERAKRLRERPSSVLWLVVVGFYGGFLQLGVGILLLFVLGGLLRYDLVRANALKVVTVGIYTVGAMAVFIVRGKVWWLEGAATALGTVFGSQLAVRFAVTRGTRWIRVALLVMIAVSVIAILAKEGL